MESLSDTLWDVVICGTGLQQSLLALALSRSKKKILHIDPNDFYGGSEAAFSLQDAESWVKGLTGGFNGFFKSATLVKSEGTTGLGPSRAYYLALAPTFIHSRSALLSQLVSSQAYRQVEFLAVGSFFIFKPAQDPCFRPTLTRIPSTREDIFSSTAVSTKAKRMLMKFLKFVLDYEESPQLEQWRSHADAPLTEFLGEVFKMDAELQTYVLTLTLSLDGNISTKDGLATIRRHLSSMGVYGPGFAAIYPKWGGLSEIAQVSCRAGAVGGAVYMLGSSIKEIETVQEDKLLRLSLSSGDTVRTRLLVRANDSSGFGLSISRLVAVVDSPLTSFFQPTVEGAPRPAVAVVAFPTGSLTTPAGATYQYPVYLSAHSGETGECPNDQSVLYLTTLSTPDSNEILQKALDAFLSTEEAQTSHILLRLQYEQSGGSTDLCAENCVITLSGTPLSLAFDDSTLDPVKEAWKHVMGEGAVESEYMNFPDREGEADEDEANE